MNPAIANTAVTRRNARYEDANRAAERNAIKRHQAALAALDVADRTNELISAIQIEHTGKTMDQVVNEIRMRPLEPAILPAPPLVHLMDAHQSLTARLVGLTLGGLALFIAGVAAGRML